jgi:hypothetical protein
MPDLFQAVEVNPSDVLKIRKHLERIREAQVNNGNLLEAINDAIAEFNEFFLNYGKPSFSAHEFHRNENASSAVYNENLTTLADDLERLYELMAEAANSTISSFNYATVVAREVNNTAGIAASKVLDLNILNNFVKGTAIVGGDDFLDSSKIDTSVGVDTTQAIILNGASAVTLLNTDVEIITSPDTIINVTPILPVKKGAISADAVNTSPTPNNIERFYEGNYYGNIGEQRPEGGKLKFKYIVDPEDIPPPIAATTTSPGAAGLGNVFVAAFGLGNGGATTINGGAGELEGPVGFYAVVPPTEEDKRLIRQRMVDGDPSTFWECEYIYNSKSLIQPPDNVQTLSQSNLTTT